MEDQENEANFFPELKLTLFPLTHSPEHPSGTTTPPLRTLVSVPFKWEEQPGKPRPCTDIIPLPNQVKFTELQLPPCRLMSMDRIITKTPSPAAVLDGPYDVGRPKFSSSRFFREAQDSFDSISSSSGTITSPDEGADVDRVLLGKKGGKVRGYFGSFRLTTTTSTTRSSSCDSNERYGWKNNNNHYYYKGKKNMRSNGGSFPSNVSPAKSTHIWGTIYEGLKQVIPPWKKSSRKSKTQVKI